MGHRVLIVTVNWSGSVARFIADVNAIQPTGGTRRTVERGVDMLREMAGLADACQREPIPVLDLVIGMQCNRSVGTACLISG